MRIQKLIELQKKAIDAFIKADYQGTLLMSMRTGKTFCFFKALYAAVNDGVLNEGDTVVFYAETVARKITLNEELVKFNTIVGLDVSKDFNLVFRCYQSGDKEADAYCYDEVDTCLSKKYSTVLKQKAKFKLGLTGTVSEQTTVNRDEVDSELHNVARQSDSDTKSKLITAEINKGQLLQVLLPICFYYPVWKAVEDGIVSPIKTTIIKTQLDDTKEYVQLNKSQSFKQTELKAYKYADKQSKNWTLNSFVKLGYGRKKAALLHNLESKVGLVKKLLDELEGNTLIYGVRKEVLRKITLNICESKTTGELLERLKRGEINTIASCKMISRGMSVGDYVDNIIFVSTYKNSTDFLQKVFRASSKGEGEYVNVYIVQTQDTIEVNWHEEMCRVKNYLGDIVHTLDLNVVEEVYY